MVSGEPRYLPHAEGAPEVPPAGGYRGARRAGTDPVAWLHAGPAAALAGAPAPAGPGPDASADPVRERRQLIGGTVLAIALLFALVLVGVLVGGGTGALYGTTVVVLQLLVAALVIGALFLRGGPSGAALTALCLTALLNVGTLGAVGAIQSAMAGIETRTLTPEEEFAAGYPGIKGTSPDSILARPSLEAVRAEAESLLADARAALTAEFGFTWVQVGTENLRPERNGYGGESMLVQLTAPVWATEQPISSHPQKLAVMDVLDGVLERHGFWGIVSLNDTSSGLDPTLAEKLYGAADPREQPLWEWYSDNYPDDVRFYAVITDLTLDTTGDFRRAQEAESARTGEPLEGLQLMIIAPELLSEADREEFRERVTQYPGY